MGEPTTVAELARAKKLPEEFLKQHGLQDVAGGGIGIWYFAEDRREMFKRLRGEPGKERFKHPAGVALAPYGLWKLKDIGAYEPVYLCEGETDTLTLWYHGLCALGLPGSNTAGSLTLEHLEDIYDLVLVPDNDQGGKAFQEGVKKQLERIGYNDPVRILHLPDGVKDVNELHARNPEAFKEAFQGLLGLASSTHQQAPQEVVKKHTWGPIALDGDDEEEKKPEMILGLFYQDKRHLLFGEPESCKSWVALAAVTEVVLAGGKAMWIDHEMDEREVRKRLRGLGLSREQVKNKVIYIHPDEALKDESRECVEKTLRLHRPKLVVVDAFSGALGVAMADDNNNVAVERWWQEVGGLLWGKGARSLVIIDHVNKNEENRGRYSSGSKRKLEGADVALSVQLLKRLQRNPSQEGLLKLTVCKDRPGWLERPYPGLVKFEFTEEGLISCALTPAAPRSEEKPDSFRPTKLMERVSRAVESSPGVSKNQVEKNVQGRAEWVRKSVDYLVQDGYVRAEDGARGAVLLTSIKPYREEETTSSPHLVRPRPDFVPDEVLRPRPTSSPPYRGDEVAGRSQFNNQERDLVPEEEGWSGEVPW